MIRCAATSDRPGVKRITAHHGADSAAEVLHIFAQTAFEDGAPFQFETSSGPVIHVSPTKVGNSDVGAIR